MPDIFNVQALAIRGDRIVATGDTDRVKATAGPQTKKIDLGGARQQDPSDSLDRRRFEARS
jgi:hypothetical protein